MEDFEPDWTKLNKKKSHRKSKHNHVPQDEFFLAAKAFVEAQKGKELSSSIDAAVRMKLSPPEALSCDTRWQILGGPLPDISVLEDRLTSLQNKQTQSVRGRESLGKKPSKFFREPGSVDLCFAAYTSNFEAATVLLEASANPNFFDFQRRTPLHLAAAAGSAALVSLLLQFGADIEATAGNSRFTPLHFAAEAGHEEVLRLLCARGACLEGLSFSSGISSVSAGLTPLCLACEKGHFELVIALCEAKAEINALFGPQSRTPLRLAASSRSPNAPRIVSYLVGLGADWNLQGPQLSQRHPKYPARIEATDSEMMQPLRGNDSEAEVLAWFKRARHCGPFHTPVQNGLVARTSPRSGTQHPSFLRTRESKFWLAAGTRCEACDPLSCATWCGCHSVGPQNAKRAVLAECVDAVDFASSEDEHVLPSHQPGSGESESDEDESEATLYGHPSAEIRQALEAGLIELRERFEKDIFPALGHSAFTHEVRGHVLDLLFEHPKEKAVDCHVEELSYSTLQES